MIGLRRDNSRPRQQARSTRARMPPPPPRSLRLLYPLRALALALAAIAAARADTTPLRMKFCTDGGCSSGCTQWEVTTSGACAPGNAGNSWISSTSTFTTVESADPLVWQLYQDNATSHSCAASHFLPTCNATIKINQGCQKISTWGPFARARTRSRTRALRTAAAQRSIAPA